MASTWSPPPWCSRCRPAPQSIHLEFALPAQPACPHPRTLPARLSACPAAATAAYPLPHALPVLIINPDNSTFELGIKEVDPCALADEADWPGPPGGRAHPLKALRVPAPSAAGGAMHVAEADTDGGSPLSVLARQRGYQGFGGGPAGGWPPRPHLHHVQLAQAGVWLPQDADEEAAGAHKQAERDGSADSSADGSSDSSAGSHDVDASAGPHTAADSRG